MGIKALQRNPTCEFFAGIVEAAHPQEEVSYRWRGWVWGWLRASFPTFPQNFHNILPLSLEANGSQ